MSVLAIWDALGLSFANNGVVQGLVALGFVLTTFGLLWRFALPSARLIFIEAPRAVIEIKELLEADILDRLQKHDQQLAGLSEVAADHEERLHAIERRPIPIRDGIPTEDK